MAYYNIRSGRGVEQKMRKVPHKKRRCLSEYLKIQHPLHCK